MNRILLGIYSALLLQTAVFAGSGGRFRQYNTENGLSQNSVYCFNQDNYGFMWIGTQDGLNRFDGYSFVIYKPQPGDSTSVSGNSVRGLISDHNGDLWIGTRTGLCKYNRAANNFTRYPSFGNSDRGPISDAITDIEEDKEGNIWMSTLECGISVMNIKTGKFTHIIHKDGDGEGKLSGNDPRGLSCGIDGHMWITTWAHGTNEYDPGTKKFTLYSYENEMLLIPNTRGGILASSSGKVYIGCWGKGIRVWDPVTKTMSDLGVKENSPYEPAGMIWNITEDKRGRIWAATAETGLFMFDPVTRTTRMFTNSISDPNSINDNNVWGVGVDRSNQIWCGTWQGGVNVLNERISAFTHYRYNPYDSTALPSKTVWAMCNDGEDGIWVGTAAGPAHFNGRTQQFDYNIINKNPEHGPTSLSNIQSLARTGDGIIWMGSTGGGLYAYDPVKDKYRVYLTGPDSNQLRSSIISTMLCDRNGDIWLGSANAVQKYNREKDGFITFYPPAKDSVPRTASVTCVRDINEEFLYAGYTTGQLFKVNKVTGEFTLEWKTTETEVTCVIPDKRGGIWIGTNGSGLFYLFNRQETRFTEKTGLPNNGINSILFDDHDVMWISTNNGICKMDPLTKEVRAYTQEDGTLGNEFCQNSVLRTNDGQFWFGGINGITAFYPDEITINQTPADVVLLSFTVLNDPYPMKEHIAVAKTIELSWRDYFFSFEYSGMEFTNPTKNRYKYMMEGFDEEWVEAGNRRYVTYTNLDPGEYTFRVMASNNDGVWNGKAAEVKIIIHPPFWRTNWFYTLCGFVLISGTWGYIRRREKKLRVEKEVLESKVEERTAELKDEKEKVSAAHKDIRDSINYARRIQDSILPSDSEWKEYLPDSFVLYMPRDVVSGDFYWLAKKESETESVLIAAADCTGHGVPGAFMSMIGNTLLNEAVREKEEIDPALILNGLHKDIRMALRQDAGSETRDGMDVAVVKLNFKEGTVDYAGANRPLIMVHENELREIRADKMPIGGLQGEEERNFTGHTFHVKKGTMIYIFTDGFADQFGGPKGKKFMVKKFYDMLREIASLPCVEQHTVLSHAIQNWKGMHEQVDDVLVIGIRIM